MIDERKARVGNDRARDRRVTYTYYIILECYFALSLQTNLQPFVVGANSITRLRRPKNTYCCCEIQLGLVSPRLTNDRAY
jgi:hypothetical protein